MFDGNKYKFLWLYLNEEMITSLDFKAFTVATNETDGFRDFFRSTKTYNIPLEVCRMMNVVTARFGILSQF